MAPRLESSCIGQLTLTHLNIKPLHPPSVVAFHRELLLLTEKLFAKTKNERHKRVSGVQTCRWILWKSRAALKSGWPAVRMDGGATRRTKHLLSGQGLKAHTPEKLDKVIIPLLLQTNFKHQWCSCRINLKVLQSAFKFPSIKHEYFSTASKVTLEEPFTQHKLTELRGVKVNKSHKTWYESVQSVARIVKKGRNNFEFIAFNPQSAIFV